nr:retrovirus-related Pol polyprotein from transposon TNT 1-94 [Tanacetum cinerariifolium]
MTQSQITHHASTSSHPAPKDRWLRDQHIELVNINGEPTEGMLTKSMAAKLTAASASECLFADFLSVIKPKKASKELKHPGWNKKDELGTVIRLKAILVAQGFSKEEGIDYDKTFATVVRMEAIRIFLAFAMNFKVFLMDVKSAFINGKLKEKVYVKHPPGFESSEFSNYVCKSKRITSHYCEKYLRVPERHSISWSVKKHFNCLLIAWRQVSVLECKEAAVSSYVLC